ncbi:uncharacterized protein LOC111712798 [Eurytemora carolleeae]|uniref:uncharacterized protein LOC111712798 n=1 Tax=Eurytemora carolleeae TaxID=1294199 RepID=UPI000C76E362|nr:uncharacterized protein LOC111712798 [Eurytemora carolleeae]|eukprot:XP_023343295.1 uncharacterized protein LOC111712798 [Eurytemora affinis]
MIYEMGNNLCFPGQKGLSRPPRDLNGFLRDAVEQENQGEGKENRNISWEQEFRRYLEKNQTDLLVYLDFVLETEKLIMLGEEEKEGNPTRKRAEEIRYLK